MDPNRGWGHQDKTPPIAPSALVRCGFMRLSEGHRNATLPKSQEFVRVAWIRQTFALPATPSSVRTARDWVVAVLTENGRDDLADSARIGVSELVTNALLHGEAPVQVRVGGTRRRPRIEVHDHSLIPPSRRRPAPLDLDDESTWVTTGRGLDLVAAYSQAWGADVDSRGVGKVVWFEPAAEPAEDPVEGALFDLEAAVSAHGEPPADPEQFIPIRLLGLPTGPFLQLRIHLVDLGRELRLLALTDAARNPLAAEFAELYLQVERERRQAIGLEALDRAMESGVPLVDLDYLVPPEAPETMDRLSDLLDRIYESIATQGMLALRPAPKLISLQRWYLGEFTRQGRGEPPQRWSGATDLAVAGEAR